jgi:hypothetical protein
MKNEQVVYGLPPSQRILQRVAGVVGYAQGRYEFADGGWAHDLARRFPASAPPSTSVAEAQRRLARLRAGRL